jgi:hypothetical protein
MIELGETEMKVILWITAVLSTILFGLMTFIEVINYIKGKKDE